MVLVDVQIPQRLTSIRQRTLTMARAVTLIMDAPTHSRSITMLQKNTMMVAVPILAWSLKLRQQLHLLKKHMA